MPRVRVSLPENFAKIFGDQNPPLIPNRHATRYRTDARSLKYRRLELTHVVILNGIAYPDGLAADLAIFDEGLDLH